MEHLVARLKKYLKNAILITYPNVIREGDIEDDVINKLIVD